jgi:4-aminobutyrate aminotransferase-like enzyme
VQQNAREVGDYARARLEELAEVHECIGDVRGSGLFFGAEMVLDRQTKAPATAFAKRVANEMRQEGILLNFLGIHYNTLKIRPPLPIQTSEIDHLIETLDQVLARVPLNP